ncbi:MAG TPA: UrcA family protein [Steroidobacteraceae bacterium]|nr:UrcA family protein [Steroidobacteraceae bacterium]
MKSSLPLDRRARVAFACILSVGVLSIGSVSALAPMSGERAARTPGDLVSDPSTSSGARTLYRRIHEAAFARCGGKPGVVSDYRIEGSDCYRDAVANSVAAVGSPVLFTLHRSEVARIANR